MMLFRLMSKHSETNITNKHSFQLATGRPVHYLQSITKELNPKPLCTKSSWWQGGRECGTFRLQDQHPKPPSHAASFIVDWIFASMNITTTIPGRYVS